MRMINPIFSFQIKLWHFLMTFLKFKSLFWCYSWYLPLFFNTIFSGFFSLDFTIFYDFLIWLFYFFCFFSLDLSFFFVFFSLIFLFFWFFFLWFFYFCLFVGGLSRKYHRSAPTLPTRKHRQDRPEHALLLPLPALHGQAYRGGRCRCGPRCPDREHGKTLFQHQSHMGRGHFSNLTHRR